MTDRSVISGAMMLRPPRSRKSKTPRENRRKRAVQAARAPAIPASASRKVRSAERRDAILSAALDEFSARGFAPARLDDVARRAGVAKGTIYLYFRDKEALFQELIRSMLTPVVGTVEKLGEADLPMRLPSAQFGELFVREIFGPRRRDVIRLMISEGRRFPKLAEFYYREVLSRIL